MKNLILLIILSLFALPVAGLAGEKLQIENTQFDLKEITSSKTFTGYVYAQTPLSLDIPLEGVKVSAKVLKSSGSEISTYTDNLGFYRLTISNIDVSYRITAEKSNYESHYYIANNYEYLYSCEEFWKNFTLYEKGKAPSDNSAISGIILYSLKPLEACNAGVGNVNVKIKGLNSTYKDRRTTEVDEERWGGDFEFTDLEADTYRLVLKRNGKIRKTMKVELPKNTDYYLAIGWDD